MADQESAPGIELRAGGTRATIDPQRGGRVSSLRVDGRELLVGPPNATDASVQWGCFLMAPWSGRLADGRLQWRGETYQLRRTHGRHAIHGLAWGTPWSVEAAGSATATLGVDLDRDGWAFGGAVRQSFQLEPDGLSIDATVTPGSEAMPAALGWHPWFRRDAVGD